MVREQFEVADKGDLPTVEKFYNQTYLPWAKASKRRWRSDHRSFKAHILKTFGAKRLDEVSRDEVEQWKVALLEGRSPATVNRGFALLRHLFNEAVGRRYLKDTPCRGVQQLRVNNQRVRFLTAAELPRLLAAADELAAGNVDGEKGRKKQGSLWLRPMITVAVNTGLRFGELTNLRWSDVDKKNRILTLRETKDGTTARVPFNDEVWLTLETLPRVANNPYVFPGRRGRRNNIKRAWADALSRAGIADFHFHDLRHTFASHLVMAGVDLNTVRELMRHKTLDTTLRYAHLAPEHRQAALAKIADVLACTSAEKAPREGHTRDTARRAVAPAA